jgi:hypothetical protein
MECTLLLRKRGMGVSRDYWHLASTLLVTVYSVGSSSVFPGVHFDKVNK